MNKRIDEMTDEELDHLYQLIVDERAERALKEKEQYIKKFRNAFYELQEHKIGVYIFDENGKEIQLNVCDLYFDF